MTSDREAKIIDAIANAEDIKAPVADGQPGQKPRLLIENCDPDRTVAALRDILSHVGGLYERGVPVRLAFDKIQGGTVAQVMTPDALILMSHIVCRPYVLKEKDGAVIEANARLSRTFAAMYLDWRGEWRLSDISAFGTN